ncbi:hypothetical protein BCR32DRAFT_284793 [Anaeromyces robustus]|uniref:Uncharacterized protein n=1 Tax=Anaeromyces robustus TaxID=1754192 RepID=A0A1Y1WQN0_9FUNG|nr:hypothetical protein BCR32DRAFT_284793 [Anaeromyces robustus]|eukprot:ORX75837.1 hypothetical protein BCR32DRAFT_284793 [Anaeromyces robustus]
MIFYNEVILVIKFDIRSNNNILEYGFSDRIKQTFPFLFVWTIVKCQIESGNSKSPFLLRSTALLNDILPIVCKRQTYNIIQ